jgi:hypothetical protein
MAENRAHNLSKNAHQWLPNGLRGGVKNLVGSYSLRAAGLSNLAASAMPANANTTANLQLGRGEMAAE